MTDPEKPAESTLLQVAAQLSFWAMSLTLLTQLAGCFGYAGAFIFSPWLMAICALAVCCVVISIVLHPATPAPQFWGVVGTAIFTLLLCLGQMAARHGWKLVPGT